MSWLKNLMRPDLRDHEPYSSARSEAGGFEPTIGIDANEFPWAPFGQISNYCEPNRYPEPQPQALINRMAAVWNIDPRHLLIGRGSDEGIDVLIRLFCQAGKDHIMICPPTYGMYKVSAKVQGAGVVSVPLNAEWQLDLPKIIDACTDETKLIFIPTPHAPIGHVIRYDDIRALCKAREGKSLIIADEAYVEFTENPRGMLDALVKYPNLVVLRTLSKAHALAGERVGAVIASEEIVYALRKVLEPYCLTQSSIRAALDTLSPNGLIQNAERRRILCSERDRMARLLPQSDLVVSVFPSVTNFLLVQTTDSKAFMQRMKQFGILPRDRNGDIPNTVRLSIGTPEENNIVLKALGIAPSETAKTLTPRLYSVRRGTKETVIDVTVNLDAPRFQDINTGIGFFDHMLAQVATHGGFGLALHCKGDLVIDQHHSIEDCGLALGEAIKQALGDKAGIARFGFSAPLDESLAQVVIDLSGRPFCVFNGKFPTEMIGGMSTEMIPHFFHSLATAMAASIHVTVTGENAHHMAESAFKATGRALRQAFTREGGSSIPSTKGVL